MRSKKKDEVLLCAVGDIGLIGKAAEQVERFGDWFVIAENTTSSMYIWWDIWPLRLH